MDSERKLTKALEGLSEAVGPIRAGERNGAAFGIVSAADDEAQRVLAEVRWSGLEPVAPRFRLTLADPSRFEGVENVAHPLKSGEVMEVRFAASYPLFLIREAWNRGMNVEDLADGFGEGGGTHGDWSAIRDSSPEAKTRMTERALNFLFPRGEE